MSTSTSTPYSPETQSRAEVDQWRGPVVVDFGTNWCGYCQATRPLVDAAFATQAGVHHLRVEDGSGRPLGRSFRVKLWPTLVFMRDGQEVERLVRPTDPLAIRDALARITAAG